jgi:hypothetical protein
VRPAAAARWMTAFPPRRASGKSHAPPGRRRGKAARRLRSGSASLAQHQESKRRRDAEVQKVADRRPVGTTPLLGSPNSSNEVEGFKSAAIEPGAAP